VVAGEIYEFKIESLPTPNAFPPVHRIRLGIPNQGSPVFDFPFPACPAGI
jgi:hypothetical protein